MTCGGRLQLHVFTLMIRLCSTNCDIFKLLMFALRTSRTPLCTHHE
jgi:hypothetical protein